MKLHTLCLRWVARPVSLVSTHTLAVASGFVLSGRCSWFYIILTNLFKMLMNQGIFTPFSI